jgi:S1-C subfamily serine protease
MNTPHLTNRAVYAVTAVAWLCLFAVTGEAYAHRQAMPRPPSKASRDKARVAVSAVGLISVRNSNDAATPRPRGSAVFISRDGVVATNYHVISFESPQTKSERLYDEIFISLSNENSTTLNPGKRYRLKTTLLNKAQDLALLRVVADSEGNSLPLMNNFPFLELADSKAVQLLEDIYIIGFPEKGGSTVTVNAGMVEGKDSLNHWIKTDARLIHGNSGGAAVNGRGQLIGIPTKVVYDKRRIDKDGDGIPDEEQPIGAVGFLRPAHLLAEMMRHITPKPGISNVPPDRSAQPQITVRGLVKTAAGGKAIAGARIGLVLLGSLKVTEENLLAWGGTNADGRFELNNPVPAGRYTLKVKAIGYEDFSLDVTVAQNLRQLSIELRSVR